MLLLLARFAAVAVVTAVISAVRMRRAHRRRAEVATGGTATCRAVLSMHDGRFRVDVLLRLILPVRLETPLPHGIAARFVAERPLELRLRGRLDDGETVIAEVGGAVLWPAGPAWLPDPDDLVVLPDSVGALSRSSAED